MNAIIAAIKDRKNYILANDGRLLKKLIFERLLSKPMFIIGIIKLKPINSKIEPINIIKNNKNNFVFS